MLSGMCEAPVVVQASVSPLSVGTLIFWVQRSGPSLPHHTALVDSLSPWPAGTGPPRSLSLITVALGDSACPQSLSCGLCSLPPLCSSLLSSALSHRSGFKRQPHCWPAM